MPHQLLAETLFNFVHPEDVNSIRKAFEIALKTNETAVRNKIKTIEYRFRQDPHVAGANSYILVESVFYALSNPFSGTLEYVVAQNRICSVNKTVGNSVQQASLSQFNHQPQVTAHVLAKSSGNPYPAQISMPMTPSPEEYIYVNESNNSNFFFNSQQQQLSLVSNSLNEPYSIQQHQSQHLHLQQLSGIMPTTSRQFNTMPEMSMPHFQGSNTKLINHLHGYSPYHRNDSNQNLTTPSFTRISNNTNNVNQMFQISENFRPNSCHLNKINDQQHDLNTDGTNMNMKDFSSEVTAYNLNNQPQQQYEPLYMNMNYTINNSETSTNKNNEDGSNLWQQFSENSGQRNMP